MPSEFAPSTAGEQAHVIAPERVNRPQSDEHLDAQGAVPVASPATGYGAAPPRTAKPVRHKEWTDGEIAELARMWALGYSGAQIAAVLPGRTRCMCLAKGRRLKLSDRAATGEAANAYVEPPQPKVIFPRDRQCRWLVGEPLDFHWCPEDSIPGTSWCARHKERIWSKEPPQQFEPKKITTAQLRGGISKAYLGEI